MKEKAGITQLNDCILYLFNLLKGAVSKGACWQMWLYIIESDTLVHFIYIFFSFVELELIYITLCKFEGNNVLILDTCAL